MRVLRIVMIVLATMMVAFLIWNLTLTANYQAETEIEIQSDASTLHDHLNDLNLWGKWATYLNRDSTLELEFSNPAEGNRAWVSWKSAEGPAGRMEIMRSDSSELEYLLTFQGFEPAKSVIQLVEKDEQTSLTWTITGELPFYARFMKGGFENVVRADMDESLSTLQSLLENPGENTEPESGELSADTSSAWVDGTNEMELSGEPSESIRLEYWQNAQFFFITIEAAKSELEWSQLTDAYSSVREYVGESAVNAPLYIMHNVFDEKHDYVRLNIGILAQVDLPQRSRTVKSQYLESTEILERKTSSSQVLNHGDEILDQYVESNGFKVTGIIMEKIILDDELNVKERFVLYPVTDPSDVL